MPIYSTDKIAFAAGFLTGSQVPKFVADYAQRLGGRLDQAKLDLRLFQNIADRFHAGSLDALIHKHLQSPDPTFRAEGEIIQDLSQQVNRLGDAAAALQGSVLQQVDYLLSGPDMHLMQATWRSFEPGVVMQPGALVSALVLAVLCALGAHAVPGLMRLLFSRRRPAAAAANSGQKPPR